MRSSCQGRAAAGNMRIAIRPVVRRCSLEILVENCEFDPAAVTVLSETPQPAPSRRRQTCGGCWRSPGAHDAADDLLFVVLIGHGTFDGLDAKFNLVGPDLESAEWAGRSVRCRGAGHRRHDAVSFPFIEKLAAPRRIVISATDSAAQRFDTVFPEYFIRALADTRPISTRTRGSRSGKHSRPRAPPSAATTSSAASCRQSGRCSTTTGTVSARTSPSRAPTGHTPAARISTSRSRRSSDGRSAAQAAAAQDAARAESRISGSESVSRRAGIRQGIRTAHDRTCPRVARHPRAHRQSVGLSSNTGCRADDESAR